MEGLVEALSIGQHVVHGGPGEVLAGRGDHKLLHLLELMDAEDAPGVPAVGAHLLPAHSNIRKDN